MQQFQAIIGRLDVEICRCQQILNIDPYVKMFLLVRQVLPLISQLKGLNNGNLNYWIIKFEEHLIARN